jgi:flagellar assembly protein FliH
MSSKARRLSVATATPVTSWLDTVGEGVVPTAGRRAASIVTGTPALAAATSAPPAAANAAQEAEIFAKGFAQGERAATAAAQEQNAALARQLTGTLSDLMLVRAEMIRHTERQMVQLALAIARRVVHREVSLDTDLLLAMMRVALDRLSDAARVTIRLNPIDHQQVSAALAGGVSNAQVTLVPDSRIARGGCRVESEYGEIDAGVDAQIQEIARALLGDGSDATA